MKLLCFLLALAMLEIRAGAQTPAEAYAPYGQLILVKLDSAPFPHPDRAKGHDYHTEHYTAESNYSDNTVGIFVPKGFRKTRTTDFVVHFHGWRNHVVKVFSDYDLIEQFSEAGRNAILVVPQGPYDVPDSFDGKLEDENGFKRFMGDVMKTLRERGIIDAKEPGKIILSAHSGGYQVLSSIVARGGMSEKVREVWLFDALYAGTENFVAWFNHYPSRKLIDIYTDHGGTKEETEKLIALMQATKNLLISKEEPDVTEADLRNNNLIFIHTGLEHNQVLNRRREYAAYLRASCLEPLVPFPAAQAPGK